jgi:ABC-type uncharacterized transport system involved in gliding motility auxiliary subunit
MSKQRETGTVGSKLKAVVRRALAALRAEGMAFLVLGVLALIAAGTWYAIGRQFDGWAQGLTFSGLGAIALYVLLRPQDLRRLFSGRAVRYGSNTAILSVAAIGIVVLINYLSTRYYHRFDLTAGRLHSLSPQSIQIVQALEDEVEIVGLYPSGQGREDFERWLDEYRAHTDRIRYRSIDPIRQPGEADQLGWESYGGGLVVRLGARSQQVRTPDEQDITSALLKVSREAKTIYFTSGHNEPSLTGFDGADYGRVAALLEENNYLVQALNLATADAVPENAALVVVAGPKTPLLADEVTRLRAYLEGGGKALLLIDPGLETGINDVLAPWETRTESMLVVDVQRSLSGDPLTPVIDRYGFHQITKDLPMVALPVAAPIVGPEADEPVDPADPVSAPFTPLARTSEQSWADGSVEEGEELGYDEGLDLPGPVTLIATIADEETRIVIVGDSDFVANDVLSQIENGRYLMLNAVNWLAEEEELIAIGPKTNVPRSIRLTAIQEGAVCFGTLILIPAAIVVAGVAVWLKRR